MSQRNCFTQKFDSISEHGATNNNVCVEIRDIYTQYLIGGITLFL